MNQNNNKMTTRLEIFLVSYPDLFMPIWEYVFAPEQIDKSLKKMENIITDQINRSKKRIQIIKYYLKHIMKSPILIDIGIDKLMSKEISPEGFDLIEQICLHNKYIPSIGCMMRHYLTSCKRGRLGIVELIFIFLQNNHINLIQDKNSQELSHWLLLQYGLNMTEYLNVKKFVELTSLKKVFNIKKYSYNQLYVLIKEHSNLITIDFLNDNVKDIYINPINMLFNNKMEQLIIPSIEQLIRYCSIDEPLLINEIDILKQFLKYCEVDHLSEYTESSNANEELEKKIALNLKTICKKLKMI